MRKAILLPGAVALVGLLVLLGLGTWQIERKAWKDALIAALEQRVNAPPSELPPQADWGRLTPENSEFMRVKARIAFHTVRDAMVYTSGSALRDDIKSPGYFVFTPVRLANGSQIVVNRGVVPDRSYPAGERSEEIVGAIRWPEPSSRWIADYDSSDASIWYVRDPTQMAKVKGWGAVAPFYIEQEAPVPPGGLPHPAQLLVRLRNDHLQYAITWYGLAAVLAVMFAIWSAGRRREARKDRASG